MSYKVCHASTDRHQQWGGPKRWVRIFIHDTTEEFYRAASKYSPYSDWTGAIGAWHPAQHRERYDKRKKLWVPTSDPHFAGVIRHSAEELTNETIVHECVHAGLAIYRSNVAAKASLGADVGPKEEHLCYIVGDLADAVFAAIKSVTDV